MRIHLIFLLTTFLAIIQYSITYSEHRGRDRSPRYDQDYDDYPQNGDMDYREEVPRYFAAVKERKIPIVTDTVAYVQTSVKAVVKLIRCILSCFLKYYSSAYCNRLFPCFYDCSLGNQWIAPELLAQLQSAKAVKKREWEMADIYKSFKCLYECITQRMVKDWATFVAVLYCFADVCICYHIFGYGL